MPLRQRLENLPVGQKLLAALLVLLTTVLLVANLTFISAAYWISQESMAPQALQAIGRLVSNPSPGQPKPSQSPAKRRTPCSESSTSYSPLRAAALYDGEGRTAWRRVQRGDRLQPAGTTIGTSRRGDVTEFRSNQIDHPAPPRHSASGHLLLVASSELPVAFYTGTLTASLGILIFSVLLWLVIARQIKRLITRPIHRAGGTVTPGHP